MTTPAVGAQVRLSYEGVVTKSDPTKQTFELLDENGVYHKVDLLKDFVTVYEIPTPITTFVVGQTVRSKSDSTLYSIGLDGYFNHQTGEFVKSKGTFTSASYELVNL